MLEHIPEDEQISSVTADGACDTAILEHGATGIIPLRKNGRLWRADFPAAVARNAILHDVREIGRTGWKRRRNYHARSRAETTIRCLKAFGERIAARDSGLKTTEIHIRVAFINRFNALSIADVVRTV